MIPIAVPYSKHGGFRCRWLVLLALFSAWPSRPLPAQQTLRDTLPSDSVHADTVDLTKRYLEAQAKGSVITPVFPLIGVEGPQPAMSRIVLERDSVDWTNAETVGDLLMRVPGVYLWRGGFVGRPENANYQGRGATAVEYYVDGFPYIPIGPDSVGVDPGLFALSLLGRVEIDRWPGLLRVYLYTRRHDRLAPDSRIEIATGYQRFARYIGALEHRYRVGFGFAIAADFNDSPTITGQSSKYSNGNFWVQFGFIKPKYGIQAQYLSSNPKRDPFIADGDTAASGAGLDGQRADLQFRAFYGRPEGASGGRIDLLYGRTHWDGSGVNNTVSQGGAIASYRSARFSATGSIFNRSQWTSIDARGSVAWSPVSVISLSADVGHQIHEQNRTSDWVGLRAGLRLPGSIEVSGSARYGSVVAAPAILTSQAQDIRDLEGTVGWHSRPAGVEVTYSHTSAFQPFGYQPYPTFPTIGSQSQTDWVTAYARISPLSWITLESWYSDPVGSAAPEGLPPTHSFSSATIRSKFWRTFPSGAFDFKAQIGMEAWSSGVIGRDLNGAPVTLRGNTIFRSLVQFKILSFLVFWDRWNLAARHNVEYVPGFPMPTFAYTFGVKWEFAN
ncbi:MAG TPA: TonB-dependent receptor [Gemmatimonadales bacterium]|nr:TonB-dependent receptor [Gemmatimonadales bacterium]